MTVLLHVERAMSSAAATMPPASKRARRPTGRIAIRCSSMQSTGNISRSAAPPISSVSKTILTLRRNRPRSCLRITNKSLRQLAKDMGMKVEERPVAVDELSTFEECAACGTAAVISPIGYIYDKETGREWKFGDEPGQALLGDVQQIAGYSVRPLRRSLRLDVGRRVVYSIRSVFREVVYEFLLTFGNTNFGTENMRSPCVTACFFGGGEIR